MVGNKSLLVYAVVALLLLTASLLPSSGESEPTNNIIIYGDIMIFNPDGSRTIKGNLKLVQGDSTVTAETGYYNEKEGKAVATGNVKVVRNDVVLTCGELECFIEEDRSLAKTNPCLVQNTVKKLSDGKVKKIKARLTSEIMEIYHEQNLVKAKDRVTLIQEEIVLNQDGYPVADTEKVSRINSEYLEIINNGEKLLAKGDVVIISDDIVAMGDRAIYYDQEEKMEIYGRGNAAKAWQSVEKREFAEIARKGNRGSDIKAQGPKIIYTGKDQILEILGEGSRSWKENQRSYVEGQRISYFVRDDRTVVVGGAVINYYPGSEPEKESKAGKSKQENSGEDADFEKLNIEDK